MEEKIIQKLEQLDKLIRSQLILQKNVLDLDEAAQYLNLSKSWLYQQTSKKLIPHFCPTGKKLYFNRSELDEWRQSNRIATVDEIEQKAANYLMTNRLKRA